MRHGARLYRSDVRIVGEGDAAVAEVTIDESDQGLAVRLRPALQFVLARPRRCARCEYLCAKCRRVVRWKGRGGSVTVALLVPAAAQAGQYAVFYRGEECLGSGKILEESPLVPPEALLRALEEGKNPKPAKPKRSKGSKAADGAAATAAAAAGGVGVRR